jgi:hypothetical protein
MRLHLNKVLPFFLITALLAVQVSVSHIHLAENHDHDGSHHQHNIQAHYASSHHASTIDSIHVVDAYNVIEFDNDYPHSGCGKAGSQLIASTSNALQLLFDIHPSGIQSPKQDSNKQRYITYSTIRLRAPPQFS